MQLQDILFSNLRLYIIILLIFFSVIIEVDMVGPIVTATLVPLIVIGLTIGYLVYAKHKKMW